MSVVDLHPEDLLDRDALGTLGETDRKRLDSHLSRCAACRLERQLRVDFARDLEGEFPLERLPGLGAVGVEPAAPASRVHARPARRRRTKIAWLLAAAALLVGGAATAMTGLAEGRWFGAPVAVPAPQVSLATAEAPRPKAHRTPVVDRPEPPAPPMLEEPVAPLQRPTRRARVSPPRDAFSMGPAVIGPAELFDSASEARRMGDDGRVLDIDRDLEVHFPTSNEAQVLRAMTGRLLLDRGDPTAALARFDSFLAAGGGGLTEDAMAGRATALDRLGRLEEGARAWEVLLGAFPHTPYAAHAKARLETQNGR